jgi:hypothetical protein
MKRSHSKDAPAGAPPRKNFLSWNKDVQPRCLRVELAGGTFFVLPYQHLICVRFEPGTDDTINVAIARHEVRITGKNLCELALAFQKLAVEWVKELPPRYATTANRDTVWITGIAVTEIQAPRS